MQKTMARWWWWRLVSITHKERFELWTYFCPFYYWSTTDRRCVLKFLNFFFKNKFKGIFSVTLRWFRSAIFLKKRTKIRTINVCVVDRIGLSKLKISLMWLCMCEFWFWIFIHIKFDCIVWKRFYARWLLVSDNG